MRDVDLAALKYSGSNIYLNDQLHGKIIESELSLVSNPVESPQKFSNSLLTSRVALPMSPRFSPVLPPLSTLPLETTPTSD